MFGVPLSAPRRIHVKQKNPLLSALCVGSCFAALMLGSGIYFLTDGIPTLPVFAAGAEQPETAEKMRNEISKEADGELTVQTADYTDGALYAETLGEKTGGFVDVPLGRMYLDENGEPVRGAFTADGAEYLAGTDGVLLTGWVETENGLRYYRSDGRMASGLTEIGGDFCLLGEDGAPVSGWSTEFDGIYFRDRYGAPLTGEQSIEGIPYFFDHTGRLLTGFVETEEGTRYYYSDGTMATAEREIGGTVYHFDEDGLMEINVQIPVPVILQNPALPNGCEVTSLAEALAYLGFDVSHTVLAQDYLPCGAVTYIDDGEMVVPDPEEEYVGNPALTSGWYCFEGPIVDAANRYLSEQDSALRAEKVSGAGEEELEELLAGGTPVIVWITQQLQDVRTSGYRWTLPDGTVIHPYGGLHCVVLTGMDAESVTFSDPIYGEWTADKERFLEIYGEMGSRAVVVR